MATSKPIARALVTGASSGIGRAFARELAAAGSQVILVARDRQRLDTLAEELRTKHTAAVEVVTADLTDLPQLADIEQRLHDDVEIDLLVNNAGYGVTGGFGQLPIEDSQGQIDLNITALTRLARAALTTMRPAGRGGIINIASSAAFVPTPTLAVYAATKAFVVNFSQTLHAEVRRDGVTITVVCPGFTRTEFQQRANYDTRAVPELAWQTPEQVVRESLQAYSRGKALLIPGTGNRLVMGLLHLLPSSTLATVIGKVTPASPTDEDRYPTHAQATDEDSN